MIKVVLASGNKHKFEEIQAVVEQYDWQLIPMKELGISADDIEETEDTFEGNALIKAAEVMKHTNKIVIADDSGLEVDALNGRPGVYSARYAGENASYKDNNDKLLNEMIGVEDSRRTAKFVTAIVCLFPNGEKVVVRGEVNGIITNEERGNNGFGYDPVFYIPELSKTYAELSSDQKNDISHRSRALEKLKSKLDEMML